jgi:uncharacterized membrane protein YhaH (DUF805 family)
MPIHRPFWGELFTVSRRTNRARWWLTALLVLVLDVIFAGALVLSLGLSTRGDGVLSILLLIPAFGSLLLSVLLSILASTRRLHDRGRSGHWLWLFYLVPAVLAGCSHTLRHSTPLLAGIVATAGAGLLVWGLIELGGLRGTAGPNRFGPDPLQSDPQL